MSTTTEKTNDTPAEEIPDYAHLVLVPIANPETASDLLHLALALAHPEEGRVIALTVSLGEGDAEEKAKVTEELREIVDSVKEEGHEVKLETVEATTIARGILDAVREFGADLVILGIKQRARGQVVLGTVAESVLDTAPCDVMVYRAAAHAEFKRVVVPVEAGFQARVAARIALLLAVHYGTQIEAMYAQSSYRSQYEGLSRIEQTLSDLPGQRRVKRSVITAQNAVEGILARTDEDDLIIVGFSEHSEFERWMFGDVCLGVLNRAEGPVIMVSRALGRDTAATRVWRRFANWVRPALTKVEQDEIIRQSQEQASLTIDYVTLMLVSAVLSALGLLLNSAAIIIGAMLVAPLISPLIALSVGMAVGRVLRARQALTTLVIGSGMAVLVAVVLGVVLPTKTPTTEMLARGSPTLLDAAVALASGIVGAYATARKDIPAALAGVAIAAALMPPLCTIGLGIAFRDADLAFGASVLFVTNSICIITAGIVVFTYLGMRFRRYEGVSTGAQTLALVLLLVAALPVAFELVSLTRESNLETNIRRELQEAVAPAQVVDFELTGGDPTNVTATVRTAEELTEEDVRRVEEQVADETGARVQVELVVLQVLRLSVDPERVEATPEADVVQPTTAPTVTPGN